MLALLVAAVSDPGACLLTFTDEKFFSYILTILLVHLWLHSYQELLGPDCHHSASSLDMELSRTNSIKSAISRCTVQFVS